MIVTELIERRYHAHRVGICAARSRELCVMIRHGRQMVDHPRCTYAPGNDESCVRLA